MQQTAAKRAFAADCSTASLGGLGQPFVEMDENNILARVPGEYIAVAARSLPDAATATEEIQQGIIAVPGQGKVLITFKRFDHRRGKTRRWFWTAEKAVTVG